MKNAITTAAKTVIAADPAGHAVINGVVVLRLVHRAGLRLGASDDPA